MIFSMPIVMLSTAQVIFIITFVICVSGLLWTIQEGRISGLKEDNQRLKDRLVTPSEYETKLRFIEKDYEVQLDQLKREKQKAIEEGNTALENEKGEKIRHILDWMAAYSKVSTELSRYKELEVQRQALLKLLESSLGKLPKPLLAQDNPAQEPD